MIPHVSGVQDTDSNDSLHVQCGIDDSRILVLSFFCFFLLGGCSIEDPSYITKCIILQSGHEKVV